MAKSLPTVPFNHPDSIGINLLAKVLSMNYLHNQIREKGGAYGSGLSHGNGQLLFYSYRDPNVNRTLDVFEDSGKWISENGIDQKLLDEAKLTIFQGLDRPVPPSERGKSYFHSRITHELEEERRKKLFEMTSLDLQQIGAKYFGKDAMANVAVVGGSKSLEEINKEEWKIRGSGIESDPTQEE